MISFKPLRRLMLDLDIGKMGLVEFLNISPSTASKLWKNEFVAMSVLNDICNQMNKICLENGFPAVKIDDIIEFIPDDVDEKIKLESRKLT